MSRVSSRSVKQVSSKSVKQKCQARVSSKSVKQECQARESFQECPARRCCSLVTVRVVPTKKRQVFSFLRSFLCTLVYIKWLHSGSWVPSIFFKQWLLEIVPEVLLSTNLCSVLVQSCSFGGTGALSSRQWSFYFSSSGCFLCSLFPPPPLVPPDRSLWWGVGTPALDVYADRIRSRWTCWNACFNIFSWALSLRGVVGFGKSVLVQGTNGMGLQQVTFEHVWTTWE